MALQERKKTARTKLIFPTPKGKPNGHMLRNLLAIVKEAELGGYWELHKFSKTYATLHARARVDVREPYNSESDTRTSIPRLRTFKARTPEPRTAKRKCSVPNYRPIP